MTRSDQESVAGASLAAGTESRHAPKSRRNALRDHSGKDGAGRPLCRRSARIGATAAPRPAFSPWERMASAGSAATLFARLPEGHSRPGAAGIGKRVTDPVVVKSFPSPSHVRPGPGPCPTRVTRFVKIVAKTRVRRASGSTLTLKDALGADGMLSNSDGADRRACCDARYRVGSVRA